MDSNRTTNELPQTVDGILLDGDETAIVRNIPIAHPWSGENHPVPVMLHSGIPLYARKERRRSKKENKFSICRLMSDPDTGLSQGLWQDFTMHGALLRIIPRPTLLFRADGVPFTKVDYGLLDDFEMAMLNHGPRQITPHDWRSFAMSQRGIFTKPEYQPPMCYLLDEQYTNPPEDPPLISDDTVRTLYLGGYSTSLRFPKGIACVGCAHGVGVHGEKVEPAEVRLRGASVELPIAGMIGLPVRARLLRTSVRESRTLYRITRLMRHPITGKPPRNWEKPDMRAGFWPTHVFRSDGIPFTVFDFFVIDKFSAWVLENKAIRNISALDWSQWVKGYVQRHDDADVSIAGSVLLTEAKFPSGRMVRLKGLRTSSQLNGLVGTVASKACFKVGRIAVQLFDLPDPVAVKLENVAYETVLH